MRADQFAKAKIMFGTTRQLLLSAILVCFLGVLFQVRDNYNMMISVSDA